MSEKTRVVKLALIATSLAIWYTITGNPDKFNPNLKNPREEKPRIEKIVLNSELPEIIQTKQGPLKTTELDFDREFYIETDRYKLIKDKDFILSRGIGFLGSLPGKLLFWSYSYGRGINAENSKKILAMLENNKEISGLTVRLSHNKAFHDMHRLFSEKELEERNNWFARVLMGIPICLKNEIWAEFARGDYYNPLSHTAVCYSNIEAIAGHEIGHHEDWQRFSSDWEYALLRGLPPITLYQEMKASLNAKQKLAPQKNYQFYRYLIPAFGTYVFGIWRSIKKLYKKLKREELENAS